MAPAYDFATRTFNQDAIDAINNLISGTLPAYPAAYTLVSDLLLAATDPVTGLPAIEADIELHRSQLFMAVGAQANSDTGIASDFIRTFHRAQKFIRDQEGISDFDMQRASNAVAQSILTGIVNQGTMPSIETIANNDAVNVGLVLFPEVDELNPAWVGVALYPLAGVDQYFRLEDDDSSVEFFNIFTHGFSLASTISLELDSEGLVEITLEDLKAALGLSTLWEQILDDPDIDGLLDDNAFPTFSETTTTPEEFIDLAALESYAQGFLIGGTDSDTLSGTARAEFLYGLSGADTLTGGGGKDLIIGGQGADTIDGGDEDDIINGGMGDDVLMGGDGNDILHGDDAEIVDGKIQSQSASQGNDELYGGDGDDQLFGGPGDDVLQGGAGSDRISGGDGVDTLIIDGSDMVQDAYGYYVDLHQGFGAVVTGASSWFATKSLQGTPAASTGIAWLPQVDCQTSARFAQSALIVT